jgi:hypothetical protein
MIWIVTHGNFEGLIRQSEVSNADSHMAHIVPDIGHVGVIRNGECSIEAGQSHVVLRSVEATQTQVVPQLRVIHTALNQSSIKSECYFRLISVEVVTSQRSNSFDIAVVECDDLLVKANSLGRIVQQVVNSGNSRDEVRLEEVLLQTVAVGVDCLHRLVLTNRDLSQFQVRAHHVLRL